MAWSGGLLEGDGCKLSKQAVREWKGQMGGDDSFGSRDDVGT